MDKKILQKFSFRYSISVGQVSDEMGYTRNPCLQDSDIYPCLSLFFSLSFWWALPPHIFSFRYSISVGQVFDETWYSWEWL